MAPVARTPHTMSAPAILPVRAKGTSEYTTIIVGHGSSAVTIQTLVAPSIHALLPDKAMAFDFLFDQLKPLHPMLNVNDLTTALSNHFEMPHSNSLSTNATTTSMVSASPTTTATPSAPSVKTVQHFHSSSSCQRHL
jgi:hypothetical protein